MSAIFVTGGTGYLGGYVLARLFEAHDARVLLMVRAKDDAAAIDKLWRGLQMHVDAAQFRALLPRVSFVQGDLTEHGLGMSAADRKRVADETQSVLHIAASLNRKSEKACLNANLRGTLSVINLAREIAQGRGGLRRFSHVSTVAVCGHRDREVVLEDESIDWDRSDYDPYGRTKKFAEHMVRELLPDVSKVFLRPSIVMGDSRFPQTTQFDMVRATCFFADMPFVPMRADCRQDIVNADWVGRAIADIHVKETLAHDIYHLSSGEASETTEQIGHAMAKVSERGRLPVFLSSAQKPFALAVDALASAPKGTLSLYGSLLKVFLPYVTYDTVFDNSRAVKEIGVAPVPFTQYCAPLYTWAKEVGFAFPYQPLPAQDAPLTHEGGRAWA